MKQCKRGGSLFCDNMHSNALYMLLNYKHLCCYSKLQILKHAVVLRIEFLHSFHAISVKTRGAQSDTILVSHRYGKVSHCGHYSEVTHSCLCWEFLRVLHSAFFSYLLFLRVADKSLRCRQSYVCVNMTTYLPLLFFVRVVCLVLYSIKWVVYCY